jgi:hypothetical protein
MDYWSFFAILPSFKKKKKRNVNIEKEEINFMKNVKYELLKD